MKLMMLTTTTNWREGWGQGGKMDAGENRRERGGKREEKGRDRNEMRRTKEEWERSDQEASDGEDSTWQRQ